MVWWCAANGMAVCAGDSRDCDGVMVWWCDVVMLCCGHVMVMIITKQIKQVFFVVFPSQHHAITWTVRSSCVKLIFDKQIRVVNCTALVCDSVNTLIIYYTRYQKQYHHHKFRSHLANSPTNQTTMALTDFCNKSIKKVVGITGVFAKSFLLVSVACSCVASTPSESSSESGAAMGDDQFLMQELCDDYCKGDMWRWFLCWWWWQGGGDWMVN